MNASAILALFVRSVREDTRARSLIWSRIGIAAAVLFSVIAAQSRVRFGAPGLQFFSSLVTMNFFAISVAGMSYFASAITEEKEEGTLGLLRMADLGPAAILLGKSSSRLVGGILLLLVQLPFAMLAMTLGGVRMDQLLGSYAILGAYLFFACNIGLLASVIAPRTGAAGFFAACLGFGFQIGLPMLLNVLDVSSKTAPLWFFTPGCLDLLLDNRIGNTSIAPCILTLVTGGVFAFLLSRILFERFCTERQSRIGNGVANVVKRARGQASRPWLDAVCWRDFYFMHGGGRLMAIKSIAYFGIATWYMAEVADHGPGFFGWPLVFLIGFSIASLVALAESLFATSRIYRLECKERTISSLLLLPQELDSLLKSKRKAVWMTLFPSLVFVGLFGFCGFLSILSNTNGGEMIWLVQGAALVVAQIYLLHALVAWYSLRMKWGGLPLALVVAWAGNSLAVVLCGLMFQLGAIIVMIVLTIGVYMGLRGKYRARLLAAASKD